MSTQALKRNDSGGGNPPSPPAPPAPPPPAAQNNDISEYRWIILIGLITAAIMEVLDTTIVNVALPQMAGNLGATFQEIAWVSTGYILSNVVVLPMTAFLAQRFGRKNYLLTSILIFIVSSFLCGTSHTLGELVLWRIIQGAGGAALLSTAQATLRQIFPREQQGTVQAIFLLGIIVAPTLGPTLGGWITDNYTWNWCFFINVPIGLISFFLVSTFLKDPPLAPYKGRVDYAGIGLLAVGLGSLQYVLEEGNQDDWFNDPTITRLAILSGICIAVMLWWELTPRNPNPIIKFGVLKNRDLSASLFLFIALGFGLYGGVYLLPLQTQNLFGFTPTESGLVLLPGGLATAFSAVLCARLMNAKKHPVDPRALIFTGVGIFATSMWFLGHLSPSAGQVDFRFLMGLRGLSLGFLFTPINQAAFGALKPSEAQQASGLINLARQLGGSFGIAILGTFLTNKTEYHRVNLIANVYSGSQAVADRQQALAGNLLAHGYSAAQAQAVTLGQIMRVVLRQAQMMAYNDCWLLLLMSFAAVAPAILILRRVHGSPGAAADAH